MKFHEDKDFDLFIAACHVSTEWTHNVSEQIYFKKYNQMNALKLGWHYIFSPFYVFILV